MRAGLADILLLPTPVQADSRQSGNRNGPGSRAKPGVSLSDVWQDRGPARLLPTPTATPYGSSGNGCPGDGRTSYAHAGTLSLQGLLATPKPSDVRSGKVADSTFDRNSRPLREQSERAGISSTAAFLRLVEWMMGFPRGWLASASLRAAVAPPTPC